MINLETVFLAHQIRKYFGSVVQEKESNMRFCWRWTTEVPLSTVIPRLRRGSAQHDYPSGDSLGSSLGWLTWVATPRFRSARPPLGLETPIYNRSPYQILIIQPHPSYFYHCWTSKIQYSRVFSNNCWPPHVFLAAKQEWNVGISWIRGPVKAAVIPFLKGADKQAQRVHDVETMLYQSRYNVMPLHRRWYDVVSA